MKNLLDFFKGKEVSLSGFLKTTRAIAYALLIFIVASFVFNIPDDVIKDYLIEAADTEVTHVFIVLAFIVYTIQAAVWRYVTNSSNHPEKWLGLHVVANEFTTAMLYIASAISFTYIHFGVADNFITSFAVIASIVIIVNAINAAAEYEQYKHQQIKPRESTGYAIDSKEIFYGDKVCTSDGVVYCVVKSVIYCKPTLCKVTERHWVADPWQFARMVKNHELNLIEN